MNPLFALKRWHYERTQTPYVAQLGRTHRAMLARARRRQAQQQRRDQIEQAAAAVKRWLVTRLPSMLATAGITGAAAALAVYVSMQPVADQLAQDNIELSHRLNEWRDVATRSATNEVTINLRGNASEVRKSVKRIAEDM